MPPTVLPAGTRRPPASRYGLVALLGLPLLALLAAPGQARAQAEIPTIVCGEDVRVLPQPILSNGPPNLIVTGPCQVTTDATTPAGTWKFANVNIIDEGVLEFVEKPNARIDFWAKGIIIENGGKVVAGRAGSPPQAIIGNAQTENQLLQPVMPTAGGAFGSQGGRLRIHLYGADQSNNDPKVEGQGIPCRSHEADPGVKPCGIDDDIWNTNGSIKVALPGGVKDYFYQYDPLYMDGKKDSQQPDGYQQGFFGYKTIGLALGGSLELFGAKGSTPEAAAQDPTYSGNSWVRLGSTIEKGATTLTLDREPGADWSAAKWTAGDEIVVTATDYLPDHSEQLTIEKIDGKIVTFKRSGCTVTAEDKCGVQWRHQGERFPLSNRLDKAKNADGTPRLTIDAKLVADGVETRAAVALLSRSITIQSEGDKHDETFDQATARNSSYSFGGQLVVRQGFQKLQVQGVEFKQLGQGGRKGHYPVHFHMARIVPPNTWLKDSSINESMTRWVVLHSTQNVTLARNVGWLSIGHGFYLEDATEIDNRFHANIGIHARAAVDSPLNPRKIPGILVDNSAGGDSMPYLSDGNRPTVFWITNNWNEFIGNAAVGAGACGACYWLVPSYNDGAGHHGGPMKWEGYAGLQKSGDFAGATPLKAFYKNSCSTAMNAFMTVTEAGVCQGVKSPIENELGALKMVSSIAPSRNADRNYYPKIGNVPHSTHCKVADAAAQTPGMPTVYDCNGVTICKSGDPNCGVTVLDHFTTSFNWADHNFAAVWLRQFWYLFDNSVITDNLLSGLTFVSGGDYTRSSVVEGYWAMARNSVFIGETQPKNPLAYSTGPIGKDSGLDCDNRIDASNYIGNSCVIRQSGIAIQKANWGTNQRLFSIYDGPTYQAGNAFLDITARACTKENGCIWTKSNTLGLRNNPATAQNASCYSPNAAIAWKQPNGFYYPPAFHSSNLYFDNVGIRHYVIAPLFLPLQKKDDKGQLPPNFGQGGTFITDTTRANQQYCYFPPNGFQDFTDIDRQTELSDNDGSLTGLANTISVNEDPFFNAPIETSECKSNVDVDPVLACNGQPTPKSVVSTAKTSPYDYVTTVVVPANCMEGSCTAQPAWDSNCGGPFCYGVPIFRQFLVGDKAKGTGEWARWKEYGCDNAADGVSRIACRWPFLRMAGQDTWQRSNMTVNHGKYYIDTTVSFDTQRDEDFYQSVRSRKMNVFQGNMPYALMLLFVKESTKQTYQIYVGKDFDPVNGIKAVRGDITKKPTQFSPDADGKWLTSKFADGILTIEANFSAVKDLTPSPANGQCRPATFCKASGSSCGCSLTDDNPLVLANPGLKKSCQDVCESWSTKDLDCPPGGCYAVQFTMGESFQANDVQHRPQPTEFPGPTVMALSPGTGDRGWETMFSLTKTLPDGKAGGTCFYDKVPGTASCLPPPAN